MTNKLCCVLNPSIICEGCGKHWCEPCNPSWNGEWSSPKKHPSIGNDDGWKCAASGKTVNYVSNGQWPIKTDPLHLKVVI